MFTVCIKAAINLPESTIAIDLEQAQGMNAKRRQEFLKGRYLLRAEVAKLLSCELAEVKFAKLRRKLQIQSPKVLSCSLAHTDSWFACAIDATAVGIDIELCQRNIDMLRIAKRFFHKHEYQWLLSSNDPELLARKLWLLKEAYVKLKGSTLARELARVCFASDFSLAGYITEFYDGGEYMAASIREQN